VTGLPRRKVRRRTAVLLGAGLLLLSVGGFAAVMLQPERIRRMVLDAVQGLLSEGYEAQIDEVEFSLVDGMARVRGFRLLRKGEFFAGAPEVEVVTRLTQLHKGRITEVRVKDLDVALVRAADGTIPVLDVLRPTAGPPGSRPRVSIQGGRVRFRDGAAEGAMLAPDAEIRLRIESVDLQESRRGGASSIEAVLWEEGGAGSAGAGGLGRIVVRGDLPAGRQGLRVLVDRFDIGPELLSRLSPGVRAHLEPFALLEGKVGEGPEVPGLEVLFSQPSADAPVEATLRIRPRGLRVTLRDVPVRFIEVRGEAVYSGDALDLEHLTLRRPDGGEIHVKGRARGLDGKPTGKIEFWARDILFDGELHDGLPEEARAIWDAYSLGGLVDFTDAPRGTEGSYDGHIQRLEPDGPVEVLAVARLVDGSLAFKGYPDAAGVRHGFDFPVAGTTGRLQFRMPAEGDAYEITLSELRGTHPAGPARAQGTIVQWPDGTARVDVTVEADEVPLNRVIRDASATMQDYFEKYAPRGIAKRITVHVLQDPVLDRIARTDINMRLDGRAGFTWREIPLPIDSVDAIIEVREDLVAGVPVPVITVRGMRGVADGATVSAEGTIEGVGDQRLRINGDIKGLPSEGAIRQAAAKAGIDRLVKLFERSDPRGPVDLHVEVSGTAAQRRDVYRVDLRGVSMKGGFDVEWPLQGLEGTVEISPEQLVFRGVRGRGPEGALTIDGTYGTSGAGNLDLVVTAKEAALDRRLLERLVGARERLSGYYRVVSPQPGLAGDARVRLRGPPDSPDAEIYVENLRGPVQPLGLKGLVLGNGIVRYAAGTVTVEGIEGFFEDRTFCMRSGQLDLDRGTGTLDMEVRRLRFPRDLVPIIPERFAEDLEWMAPDRWFHADSLTATLSDGFNTLRLDGLVALSPPREGATGGLGLEGVFDLQGLTFAKGPADDDPTALSGTVVVQGGKLKAGVEVEELTGPVELSGVVGPRGNTVTAVMHGASARVNGRRLVRGGAEITFPGEGVLVRDLRGTLAGGNLEVTVQKGSGRPGLQGRVTLSNAAARQLFVPDDALSEMEGKVTLDVRFRSPTGKTGDLVGEGTLDLVDGKLFKVPVFEAIYGILGVDDSPEFEVMRLKFSIKGDRLKFQEILLDSGVLAVHQAAGDSYAWMDGRVDVTLIPEFKGGVFDWPIIKTVLEAIGLAFKPLLYTFHVGGTLQNYDVSYRFFGAVFDSKPGEQPRLLPPPPAVPVEPRAPIGF